MRHHVVKPSNTVEDNNTFDTAWLGSRRKVRYLFGSKTTVISDNQNIKNRARLTEDNAGHKTQNAKN